MTAEVAVMNRSAVALAADSAVTLSGIDPSSEVDKISQNENKLFELSKQHPVAAMIYNATSFFEVPWEVIIKDFRRDDGDKPSDTVFDWATRFRSYLMAHAIYKPTSGRQTDFIFSILDKEVAAILSEWLSSVRPLLFERQTKKVREQYPQKLLDIMDGRVRYYESAPFYDGFDEAEADRILALHDTEFEAARKKSFDQFPFSQSHQDLLARVAKGVLSRARRNWFTTGVVVAGYGSKELFPSLISIEIGGVVGDKLRWSEKRKVDIDRSDSTAEIIPFAQRETVDTLLFGRSSLYEQRVVRHFSTALSQVGKSLVDQLTSQGTKRRSFEARLEAAVNGVVANFRDHHAPQLRDAFAADTLDIVRHMPKPDLAAFAESLVTVSSMKRKVTVGPETVGGPIDVAVISRHEGFIWVKRKHYFDADLNRRYMWRSFGQNRGDK